MRLHDRKIQLLDKLGNATIRPKIIEIKAANSDTSIVAPKPPTRNFILIHPDLVEGSITYQPQLPLSPEQPTSNKNIDTTDNLIQKLIIHSIIKDLVQE